MRRIQRLCGLQLVWLLFLDSKWQTARQTILFCGVSRNDEAIRRVVLSAVYRNSAIALRSFEINKITSSVLVLRNILHSFPTTSVYALLQYLWEIGVQLASPAFLHHRSQTTSPVSVLWIFHDISIVCGWAVALFCTKTLQMCEWPRAPTASCMK